MSNFVTPVEYCKMTVFEKRLVDMTVSAIGQIRQITNNTGSPELKARCLVELAAVIEKEKEYI